LLQPKEGSLSGRAALFGARYALKINSRLSVCPIWRSYSRLVLHPDCSGLLSIRFPDGLLLWADRCRLRTFEHDSQAGSEHQADEPNGHCLARALPALGGRLFSGGLSIRTSCLSRGGFFDGRAVFRGVHQRPDTSSLLPLIVLCQVFLRHNPCYRPICFGPISFS